MPLKNLLAELMRQAELRPGVIKRSGKLMHGLEIAIRYNPSGESWQVQLSRAETWPGDREWKTVMSCMDGVEQVGEIKRFAPDRGKNIDAYFLLGHVRKCVTPEPKPEPVYINEME
jgi:hypothetical protein